MKNERILSYLQASVMSKEEVESITGAGMSTSWTAQPSYQGGPDGTVDLTVDF